MFLFLLLVSSSRKLKQGSYDKLVDKFRENNPAVGSVRK
jgi:hypothetical protein